MKSNIFRLLLIIVFTHLAFSNVLAQQTQKNSLNSAIEFGGSFIIYEGKKINLGPKAFYIDGQLSDAEVSKYKYVFNSVNKAAKQLVNGSEADPMILYIAPWVYWIDNPDDPAIREPKTIGGTPFGLEIDCEWLKFYGLSANPTHVILASNRGQTMGANGNFTMFRITGNGTGAENITFGNYCNIDLEYPLNPLLNRPKRGSAIVQAQLVFCFGDKLVARNTHFISRLNLCPFWGGKRTLFDRCHFESTDDALAPTGVYLNSTFDIYSSKPFGHTQGTGAVLLNCDINSYTRGEQYFVKSRGQVAAVDCRMHTNFANYWGWRAIPDIEARYYNFKNQINGKDYIIGLNHSYATVNMEGKSILNAYRLDYNGNVLYNTYNLLRGNDDWDPMGVKEQILEAEKITGKTFTNLPTQLVVTPSQDTIETGKNTIQLKANVLKFGNYEVKTESINWSLPEEYQHFVKIETSSNGTCTVIPTNQTNYAQKVTIYASTAAGLEAASVLYSLPTELEAPQFSETPKIKRKNQSVLSLNYKLNSLLPDQSLISWYRCSSVRGENPIEITVSRNNNPNAHYQLSKADKGWFIMAKIKPKNLRSNPGNEVAIIYPYCINEIQTKFAENVLSTDFSTMSTANQPVVIPGFWTLDSYAPADTFDWLADNTKNAWYYGAGEEGSAQDTGLVQATKGARLRYTPIGKVFNNMTVSFTAIPAKTAGQGFSSARQQYMDVFIKFDNYSLTGYALRIIRTTKYGDALDFVLMEYKNGIATTIGEPISTDCYRPNCHIILEVKNNTFKVFAHNPKTYYVIPNRLEVTQTVELIKEITQNNFGGFGFQHTGTVGSGATLIKDLKVICE